MKRTELEKKERELRKQQKKISKIEGIRRDNEDLTTSGAINKLYSLFQYDENEIYNIEASEEILEFTMQLQESFTEKEFENIIRKSIKKTKVTSKQEAFDQVAHLLN